MQQSHLPPGPCGRPFHRRGKGIGEALVRYLCDGSADAVCLTTISRRKAFYERVGFEELPFSEVPR
jgi:predicted N-acetyltransferase YhbS